MSEPLSTQLEEAKRLIVALAKYEGPFQRKLMVLAQAFTAYAALARRLEERNESLEISNAMQYQPPEYEPPRHRWWQMVSVTRKDT